MDYKKYNEYRDNRTALTEVTALVERLAKNKIKVFSGGDNSPLDKDKHITRWLLAKRLNEMGGPSLEQFDNVIDKLYRQARGWRRENKPNGQLTFKQRWVQKVGNLEKSLSEWRDEVVVEVKIGNLIPNVPEWHVGFENGATSDQFPFKLSTEKPRGLGCFKVRVAITTNFLKKVVPFFRSDTSLDVATSRQVASHNSDAYGDKFPFEYVCEPFVERVSKKAHGDSTYQYLVLHIDEPMFEAEGQSFDHGIKVRKFHGLETYGRKANREVVPVTRYLAYTGDTCKYDSIIGTATSAWKAYQLLKSRIARDLLKKL